MQSLTNGEIVRLFIQRFWNEAEVSCVEQYLTNDYEDHAYQPHNKMGLISMAATLQEAFPDQISRVESLLAEGDRVVVRLRMTGTHLGNFRGKEATNQAIDVRVYREYRLEDGKIAEHWALFDTANLLRQIGAELNEQPACQLRRP